MEYQLGQSMNRDQWEFEYTAAKLAEAAETQKAFRLSRVEAWSAKKDEVMAKVKESGLTIHEGVAGLMGNTYSNRSGGAEIMVDSTLQSDLSECVQKIKSHKQAADSYDGWIQVVLANSEARLKLKYQDWMFFFGK